MKLSEVAGAAYTQEWIKLSDIVNDTRRDKTDELVRLGVVESSMDLSARTIMYGQPGINDIEFAIEVCPTQSRMNFADLVDDEAAEEINDRMRRARTPLTNAIATVLNDINRQFIKLGATKFYVENYRGGTDQTTQSNETIDRVTNFNGQAIISHFEKNTFYNPHGLDYTFRPFILWWVFPNGVKNINRNLRGLREAEEPVVRLYAVLEKLIEDEVIDLDTDIEEFNAMSIADLHDDPEVQRELESKEKSKMKRVHPDDGAEAVGFLNGQTAEGEFQIRVINGVLNFVANVYTERDTERRLSLKIPLKGEASLIVSRLMDYIDKKIN